MVTPRRLDVYEAAYLAGGPRRVVEVSLGLVNEIVAGVLSRGGVGPFPASALTLW